MTRDVATILGELRGLHSMQADAQVQLTSVRREIDKLISHEASILAAIDGRGRKIDRTLDEYTQAMNELGKALT